MKKLITAIVVLFFTTSIYSQKKDTVAYVNDSVSTISLVDMQKVLDYMSERLSKKEWDIWLRAYQELANATVDKRKIKTKK